MPIRAPRLINRGIGGSQGFLRARCSTSSGGARKRDRCDNVSFHALRRLSGLCGRVGRSPGTSATGPVSYTHLDVYKRQALES